MFKGFSDDTIQFFLDIRFHNHAEFFHHNKARYERVKAEFASLIYSLEEAMSQVDERIDFRPGKALSRLRRDVRFTKDKTPYRDHLWFILKRAAEERDGAPMFWFELSIEKATLGVGIWGEHRPYYNMLRKELIKNDKPLAKILEPIINDGFSVEGNRFKRIKVPAEITKGMQDIYKAKSLYISKDIEPYSLVFQPNLSTYLIKEYEKLSDFYRYARTITDKVLMENQQ